MEKWTDSCMDDRKKPEPYTIIFQHLHKKSKHKRETYSQCIGVFFLLTGLGVVDEIYSVIKKDVVLEFEFLPHISCIHLIFKMVHLQA